MINPPGQPRTNAREIAEARDSGVRECVALVRWLTAAWRRDATETSDPGYRRWEMTLTGERIERRLERLVSEPVSREGAPT